MQGDESSDARDNLRVPSRKIILVFLAVSAAANVVTALTVLYVATSDKFRTHREVYATIGQGYSSRPIEVKIVK